MECLELEKIRQDIYCTLFEQAIEDHVLINYEQKVVAKESKLSVRSVEPYTKTQVNFLNGNQFFGDMNDCQMTGNGRYLWADDGTSYEGEFNRPNVIEGRGTFKFKNADKTGCSRYSGIFVDGKFHGKGQLTNNFFKFTGNFDQNRLNGKGHLKCGIESFDGKFAMDKKVCGKRAYTTGVFVGDFNDDETRKFGKYEFDNGDAYCGSFERDMFSGFGEYTWRTESGSVCKYVGTWKNNLREGLGTIKIDAIVCVAIFHKNLKTGAGIILSKDGRVYAANEMFYRDEFIGCFEVQFTSESLPTLRKLLNMEGLQVKSFKSLLGEVLAKNVTKAAEVSPFHTCWFNLNVNHDAIWKFILQFPKTDMEHEFASIEQTIRELEGQLTQLYQKYGDFSSKATGKHATSMARLGLWQMVRELGLFRKSATFNSQKILDQAEIEFNILTLKSDDPLEIVPVSSFVQYVLFITLFTNKHHDYISAHAVHQRSTTFGLFASMFVIMLRDFFFPLLKQPLGGLIPRIVNDDSQFLTNFLTIINLEGQKLSIRNVFGFIEQWKSNQSINPQKGKLGELIELHNFGAF